MSDKPDKSKTPPKMVEKEEHIEAHQAKIDENRRKYVKTLSEENRKKFAAAEKAQAILTEAGVAGYVFAHLPQPKTGQNRMWQFNNVFEVHGFNKDGTVKESSRDVSDDLIRVLMETYYQYHQGNPMAWAMIQNAAIARSFKREDEDLKKLKEAQAEEDDD